LPTLWLTGCLGAVEPPQAPPPDPSAPPLLFQVDMMLPAPRPPEPGFFGVPIQFKPRFSDLPNPSAAPPAASPRHALPLSGGTLLVLRDGVHAIAADPDRDRVFVADIAAGNLLGQVALTAGDQPGRATEDAAGRVHVVLRGGGALITLAPPSYAAVSERRTVCPAPRGVASAGDRVYVACAGGELVALPATGGPPLWTSRITNDLRDVVVDRKEPGRLLVSTFRSAELHVVDAADGRVQAHHSPPVALNLTRRRQVSGKGPASTRFVPSVAWRTVALPDGGALMLHQRAFTGEVPADSSRPEGSGGYGGANNCGGIVQAVLSRVGPGRGDKPADELGGLLLGIDLALAADGSSIAMVSPADAHVPDMGSLVVVAPIGRTTATGELDQFDDDGCTVVGFRELGAGGPRPWRKGGESDIVGNRLLGEAVAVAFDQQGNVAVQLREPAELRVPARGVRIALPTETRADAGFAIFHSNTGAGIACASCHPEGGEDGRTWTFVGLGPRRTQSLRGGLSTTLPLHWDGDMRDLAHIAREVFTGRMGGPMLMASETDALAAWLEQLPLLPHAAPADASAVARGRALFESAAVGCASCHAGPQLTNNQTVDVGTGRPLQVPSLRGLADRAPYMHTGCAPTLAARFSPECGGGERHGTTRQLGAAEAADLTAYLESL
jgi:mono/diheme cytochrome c family protein